MICMVDGVNTARLGVEGKSLLRAGGDLHRGRWRGFKEHTYVYQMVLEPSIEQ